MARLPASTARRSNSQQITEGDAYFTLLDLPSIDAFGNSEGWTGQRGHVLIRLIEPIAATTARRSIEWRITVNGRFGSTVTRGKIGASNVDGAGALIEAPRQGGAVLPIYGGFVLEVQPYLNPGGATMRVEAVYAPGEGSGSIPTWETSYQVALTSDATIGTAGPWQEIGPPPYGATRYSVIVPDVSADGAAPGPLELEWQHANGTRAALEFLDQSTGLLVAPQGFHARIRTGPAYGDSGYTARVLWNWSN